MSHSERLLDATRGSGTPLRELRTDARSLSPEDFEDRHGSAFLLLTAADLVVPKGPGATDVQLEGFEPAGDRTASLSLLAFPVQPTGRSTGHLITVGRTSNNDIVVRDATVSRFHAFLKAGPGGGFVLQDAGSSNGTTVNGTNVAPQNAGPPTALKNGDNVRLGRVEFTYLDVAGLRDFLLAHER